MKGDGAKLRSAAGASLEIRTKPRWSVARKRIREHDARPPICLRLRRASSIVSSPLLPSPMDASLPWTAGGGPHDARLVAGFAFAALLIAHGADADLDPREVDALAERLHARFPALSGGEAIAAVRTAAERYARATLEEATEEVIRLGRGLGEEGRRALLSDLAAVAEADGVVHPMESALLRHIAEAWHLEDEARRFGAPEA